jgi:hypothetical protein
VGGEFSIRLQSVSETDQTVLPPIEHEHLTRKLERFTDRIAGVEAEKQNSINRYAAGGMVHLLSMCTAGTVFEPKRKLCAERRVACVGIATSSVKLERHMLGSSATGSQ